MRSNRHGRVSAPGLRSLAAILVIALCSAASTAGQPSRVRVGAKSFTEQEILGELVAGLLERTAGVEVVRRFGPGGTDICHTALIRNEIDLYVEYTGTALLSMLGGTASGSAGSVFIRVSTEYRDRFDLEWLPPIGFNNTYAVAVRADDARARQWSSIGDLAGDAGSLRAGFTGEFIERPDGLPGLRRRYGLELGGVVDLDPGLLYEALRDGHVDLISAFATDGRIDEYGLVLLRDDRQAFPPYHAAPVVRAGLLERDPRLRAVLTLRAGAIDDASMRAMNHAVDVRGERPRTVAARWLDRVLGPKEGTQARVPAPPLASRRTLPALLRERWPELRAKLVEHLLLTLGGVAIAMVVGIPVGVVAHRVARIRSLALAATEVVQTIPSLAMLAFLFAIYGMLGAVPAITALALYALMPIVLNTVTGLREVPDSIVEAARGAGMTGWQSLRMVELPLALPVMLAGIRTAAVLTVGIATLSTYIGAGGLGDFIARGLARNDPHLTLLGAIPAALLAVAIGGLVRIAERRICRTV